MTTTEGDGAGAPAKPATPGGDGAADTGGIGVVLYKLALAGVGALLLAQEELEVAWKKRAASGDGAGAPEARPKTVSEADAVETKARIDGTIGRALRSLSIPTRADVEGIDQRIDAIQKRMDALGL
jgi:hypothetical protein